MFSWKSDRNDEFALLRLVLTVLLVGGMVAVLIEFNARRQAAAMTREMLRPATSEEQALIAREVAAMEAALVAPAPRPPSNQDRRVQPRVIRAPLNPGERCISGQRFRRLENGWEEIGTC